MIRFVDQTAGWHLWVNVRFVDRTTSSLIFRWRLQYQLL